MKELLAKWLKLQAKIQPIVKSEDNPFFKSKYFDINSLIAEVKPLFTELDLVVMQPLTHIDGKPAIETIIYDTSSGESISRVTPLIDLQDAQKLGGAITYQRRYSLVSWLLLEAEDDDGNTATGKKVEPPKRDALDDAFAPIAEKEWRDCAGCEARFEVNPKYPFAKKCMQCNIKAKNENLRSG